LEPSTVSPSRNAKGAFGTNEFLCSLNSRLGDSTFTKSAMECLAVRIVAAGSNRRAAFQVASEAVRRCMRESSREELNAEISPGQPTVTFQTVRNFMFETPQEEDISKIIQLLRNDEIGTVLLCVATALAQEKVAVTTVGVLKMLSNQCIEALDGMPMTNATYLPALAELHGLGLFTINSDAFDECTLDGSITTPDDTWPVSLGVRFQDAAKGLSEHLSKHAAFLDALRARLDSRARRRFQAY